MGFPDEVYMQLASNREMVPFVSIEKLSSEADYDQMKVLGELTTFYNFTLIKQIKNELSPPNCEYQIALHRLIFHKLKFISSKILSIRRKHRENMIKFADSIINFLTKWPPTDDNMVISVKIEKLKNYLVEDPPKVKALLAKYNNYLSVIKPVLNAMQSKEDVVDELRMLIENVGLSVDERTSFCGHHKLQHKFERLFLSPQLSYKEKVDELMAYIETDNPQIFLQSFFQLVSSVLTDLGILRKPLDSALVLLLMRLVFDNAYESNKFLKTDGENILEELKEITFDQLNPPREFCPPVENGSEKIIDIFKDDQYFKGSVDLLQLVVFCNNPLDILDCIDRSLFVLEKAATIYDEKRTLVFPFEVTFSLFMAVAISSQVSNWIKLSQFVENYTPMNGLCPSFEFSKAKIIASAMQFKSMINDSNGTINEGAMNIKDFIPNIQHEEEIITNDNLEEANIESNKSVEEDSPLSQEVQNNTDSTSNESPNNNI